MAPEKLLPYPEGHQDADSYVDALLGFLTTSHMLQTLCGGVHILDFMTSDPDLYGSVLPADWREWLEDIEIMDFLELLMRDDLRPLYPEYRDQTTSIDQEDKKVQWRGRSLPPQSLLDYIASIRHLSLERTFTPENGGLVNGSDGLSKKLAVGMKPKKAHEVQNFAAFVDTLARHITIDSEQAISHLVDFGSGQNYLGRVLASHPYCRQVIAVERKHVNVDSAKRMDITAQLGEKKIVLRNKKQWKATGLDDSEFVREAYHASLAQGAANKTKSTGDLKSLHEDPSSNEHGKILHVEHEIQDGNLDPVVLQLSNEAADGETVALNNDWEMSSMAKSKPDDAKRVLCISLHSCGNLSHHGIRSLVLNPFVKGVALVGCCYNLVTERLGLPTYKLPSLRPANKRLENTSSSCDPHGFPMSEKMANYSHEGGKGVRLNITARMMAVQAPENWTKSECDSFFTRHFYRALLQRLFLDRGVVKQPGRANKEDSIGGVSPAGFSGGGEPIILGSLRKSCYTSFVAYVRGAVDKLKDDPGQGNFLQQCMAGLTDEEIAGYERRFQNKRHHLCLVWSLMAFSAGVIESAIVADRWLFLKEQEEVKKCWVQTVFDYKQSPRNLVVVGLK